MYTDTEVVGSSPTHRTARDADSNQGYQKYGDRCEILTGIPKPKRGILTAGEDKANWSKRMLAENVVVNIVFRKQKSEYCTGRDCILIDDLDKNIKAWEDLGGTGIVHKDAERTLLVLKSLGLL